MFIKQLFAINNNCYKANGKLAPKGIMVHSTGANNPFLKRYVQPDDGQLGKHPYDNHFNVPLPAGRQVCVHAFIGKLQNGNVACYQTLPWTMRAWHAGGKANDTHIGFEICEDDLQDKKYFNEVYNMAVELCVMLCKQFNLTEKDIIDHSEGYKNGIASNHGDIKFWFSKQGKTMDMFRADVKRGLTQLTDRSEPVQRPNPAPEQPQQSAGIVRLKIDGVQISALSSMSEKAKQIIVEHIENGKGKVGVIEDAMGNNLFVYQKERKAKVTASALNIRMGIGTGYPIVGTYTKGQEISILQEKDEWFRTDKGWVSGVYVQLIK